MFDVRFLRPFCLSPQVDNAVNLFIRRGDVRACKKAFEIALECLENT